MTDDDEVGPTVQVIRRKEVEDADPLDSKKSKISLSEAKSGDSSKK
jgi:hypothetical protein